jgi:hypothetical protein
MSTCRIRPATIDQGMTPCVSASGITSTSPARTGATFFSPTCMHDSGAQEYYLGPKKWFYVVLC